MSKREDYLFELSWEVCNKVGGIHTVISSKIHKAQENFNNYFCVGPYFESSLNVFEKKEIPLEFENKISKIEELGIKLHFGSWLINGKPSVILVEYLNYGSHINDIKKTLWDDFKIDSLGSSWYDFDEAILWSWVSGLVIDMLTQDFSENILVHAHEWMSGGSIAYFKSQGKENKQVSTIFTTHATMLGRTITGNQENLYSLGSNYDFEKRAYELGVHTKHQFEKCISHISDSFTTVSDITAKEAALLYQKEVDVILYNGFDYPLEEYDLEKNYLDSRKNVHAVLDTLSYDSYDLNLDNSFLFYISGRYEIHNKGVDVLIKALSKLNKKLKEENSNQEIIVWFMLMFGDFDFNDRFKHNSSLKENKVTKEKINEDILQTPYELGLNNEVLHLFRENNLFNKEEDKVKVILTPENFTQGNKLHGMSYYEFIQAFDLGILPSFYEPWGYTPAESLACSVPCFTTDLAGIGRYDDLKNCSSALRVLDREDKSDEEFIDTLFSEMYVYLKESQKEKLILKQEALKCSEQVSWNKFYIKYLDAYDLAKR